MDELTPRQQLFVDEYLIDLDAKGAAIRAGYSKKTAGSMGCENLTKPKIQAAINRSVNARAKRTRITQDRVLEEIARLAFFDIRKLYDENENLIPIPQLPEDVAAAIGGLDVSNIGDLETTKKLKIIDKKGSLELLGKHLKLFTEKVDVNLDGDINVSVLPAEIAEIADKYK